MTAYLLGAVSGSLPVLLVLLFVRPRWKQLLWLMVMAAFCVFMIYATSTGLVHP